MLRVGVIGCGTIAQVRHIPEFAENKNCELTAFYSVTPGKAENMAKQYGGKGYTDLEAFLDSGLDAVSVCVTNALHAPVTIKALERGIHVLCEKPMAVTLEECQAMVEAAKKNNRKLMIAQNQRFAPAHVEARRRIAAGEIGKILSFDTVYGHGGPEAWAGQENPWFFDKKSAAFGAMADIGVHKTDLLHYLLGEHIVKVSAMFSTMDKKYPDGNPIAVEDNAFCLYQTASGITGTMHVSWTQYGEEINSTVIQGSQGVIRCYADPEYALIVEKKDGSRERLQLGTVGKNEEKAEGKWFDSGVIAAFVDSILKDTVPPIDGEEAMKAMQVIFAAEKSNRTGEMVSVF